MEELSIEARKDSQLPALFPIYYTILHLLQMDEQPHMYSYNMPLCLPGVSA